MYGAYPWAHAPRLAMELDGSTDYLGNTSAFVTAVPLSMAAWFKSRDGSNGQYISLVVNYAGGASGDFHALVAKGSSPSNTIGAASYQGGGPTGEAVTSTGYTVGKWHHACGVWAGNSDRRAYIDGGSKGTDATAATPGSLSRTGIGRTWRSDNPGNDFNGYLCDVAFWNIALTDFEVLDLARGKLPIEVRPFYLLAWYPLWGPRTTAYRDFSITTYREMTPYGTPTWGGGPRGMGTLNQASSAARLSPRLRFPRTYAPPFIGTAEFYGTVLGNGVASNAYTGISMDESGNLRASGQVYEGTA